MIFKSRFKQKIYEIIYEADTPMGKFVDLVIISSILLSVLVVLLDSVPSLNLDYGRIFELSEIAFTVLFLIEYILRIYASPKPWAYIKSFYGIIDLLAILPTFISFFIPHKAHYLIVIRTLRVLRIFRILKLTLYVRESRIIANALRASARKILVFTSSVMVLVAIFGTIMYLVESSGNPGFKSIPQSIYWAIVTVTTVGYGDVVPMTAFGKIIASGAMILGYAIIAVPTGIVTAEISRSIKESDNTQVCPNCLTDDHRNGAEHCWKCGTRLND